MRFILRRHGNRRMRPAVQLFPYTGLDRLPWGRRNSTISSGNEVEPIHLVNVNDHEALNHNCLAQSCDLLGCTSRKDVTVCPYGSHQPDKGIGLILTPKRAEAQSTDPGKNLKFCEGRVRRSYASDVDEIEFKR